MWIAWSSDHHRYRPSELRHMAGQFRAKGANVLVTTEKDALNLCDDCDSLIAPLPLYWLKIGMRIDGEAELLRGLWPRMNLDERG